MPSKGSRIRSLFRVIRNLNTMISLVVSISQAIILFYTIQGSPTFIVIVSALGLLAAITLAVLVIASELEKSDRRLKEAEQLAESKRQAEIERIERETQNKLNQLAIVNSIGSYISDPKTEEAFKNSIFYKVLGRPSDRFDYYFIQLSQRYGSVMISELKDYIKEAIESRPS